MGRIIPAIPSPEKKIPTTIHTGLGSVKNDCIALKQSAEPKRFATECTKVGKHLPDKEQALTKKELCTAQFLSCTRDGNRTRTAFRATGF